MRSPMMSPSLYAFLLLCFCFKSCIADIISQTNAPGKAWMQITSDRSGQYLVSVDNDDGAIWVSQDYGSTWTQPTTAPGGLEWQTVTNSADGKYAYAGDNPGSGFNGKIYRSQDYGTSWEATSSPPYQYFGVACSGNGQRVVAAMFDKGIYLSDDFGDTWTKTSAPSAYWGAMTSSSTGEHIAAVIVEGGGIWISGDYGETWTHSTAPGGGDYWAIKSSASGQYIAAADGDYFHGAGTLQISADYGVTWTAADLPPSHYLSVSMDDTGQHLAAGSGQPQSNTPGDGVGIYYSADYGITWTKSLEASETVVWMSMAADSSGDAIAAAQYGGGIYKIYPFIDFYPSTVPSYPPSSAPSSSAPSSSAPSLIPSSFPSSSLPSSTPSSSAPSSTPSSSVPSSSMPTSSVPSSSCPTSVPSSSCPTSSIPSSSPSSSQPSSSAPSSSVPSSNPTVTSGSHYYYQNSSIVSHDAVTVLTNLGYGISKKHFLSFSFLQTGFGGQYQNSMVRVYAGDERVELSPTGGCGVDGVCGSDYILCIEVEVSKYVTSDNGGTLRLYAEGEGSWSYDICGGDYAHFEVQYVLSQQYIPQPTPVPNAPSPSDSRFPTAVPSCSLPTSVPTYNPTLDSENIHEFIMNSSMTITPYVQKDITNLGYDFDDDVYGEYYLSVSFLQTGFGDASGVFVDVYTVIGGVEATLRQCSVYNNCGDQYITCFANLLVSDSISKETGGTLTVGARASASWKYVCGTPGDVPFEVKFTLSHALIPTQLPTRDPAPTSDDNDNEKDEDVYASWVFTLVLSFTMAIFGSLIRETRLKRPNLFNLEGIWVQYALVFFGFSFGSQMFFIYKCLLNEDYVIYGLITVLIKVCVLIWSCVYIYTITQAHDFGIDHDLIAEQIGLYSILGFLCCLQSKLIFLLPWYQCDAADITGGFPSFRMYCVTSCILIIESLLISGVNVAFVIDSKGFGNLDQSTRISLFMTTVSSVMICFLSFIEMVMLNHSYKARRKKKANLTQKLIP